MYFSRIQLKTSALDPTRLADFVCGEESYAVHQQLWRLFAETPDTRRDFLFRREQRERGLPIFYVVSVRAPQSADGLFHVETKPYQPRLSVGQRLGFSLRANPVVSVRKEDGRSVRHDIVMHAKKNQPADGERVPEPILVQQCGTDWLSGRAEKCGFDIVPEEVRADGYRQHGLRKAKDGHMIQFSTVDFHGSLTVNDPEAFEQALFHGIGPAKAFGCGLLLVRRL